MSRTLSLKTLRAKRACVGQCDKFERRFGQSVRVTQKLCVAVASVFDFDWAAQNLLSTSAHAEYKHAVASARAEYKHAVASAWAEFERAVAPAWAEYKRVEAPARAEYERVRAIQFARSYNNDRR